jgi:hypothetical protein
MAAIGERALLAHLVEELQIKPASASSYAQALLAQDFDVELFHEVRCANSSLLARAAAAPPARLTARSPNVILLLT